MNPSLRTSLLLLTGLAAIAPPPPVEAQTVTTPPRSITSQQETPGVDSTFQGNVQPNAQTSTFQMTVTGSAPAPAPPPAPPPVTCTASSSSKTITQAASCPAGYTTTAGSSTFTQSATQTTTTTCPNGAYGSPSTSTSTGAWSPTPAAACTVATTNYITGNFSDILLFVQGQPDMNGQSQTGFFDLDTFSDCVSGFVGIPSGSNGNGPAMTTAQAQAECAEIYNEVQALIVANNSVPWSTSGTANNMTTTQTGQKLMTMFNKNSGGGKYTFRGWGGQPNDPNSWLQTGLCGYYGINAACPESIGITVTYTANPSQGGETWPQNGKQ